MKHLKEEDETRYQKQFSSWDKVLGGKTVEALYKGIFTAIREDPVHHPVERKHPPVHTREGQFIKSHGAKYPRPKRLNNAERKERVKQKILRAAQG